MAIRDQIQQVMLQQEGIRERFQQGALSFEEGKLAVYGHGRLDGQIEALSQRQFEVMASW